MSSAILSQAQEALLVPAGIDEPQLDALFGELIAPSIDWGDLYFQSSQFESWMLENGIVRDGRFSLDQGVGVRAIAGTKTGFAYSDQISQSALLEACGAARAIAYGNSSKGAMAQRRTKLLEPRYVADNPLASMTANDKVALLRSIERHARAQDPRVTEVVASLSGSHEYVVVVSSDGTVAGDVRPLIRVSVQVNAQLGDRRETGYAGGGGRFDYQRLLTDGLPNELAKEAVRLALTNLEAIDAPAGEMPVVLGPGWPGVLLHEAVGHGLEGDFNRKGTSAFSGRMGEQVASPLCTVVDDGTLADRRGSLTIDDEGTATQCTTLIEDGVLVGYLQDKHNASLMGMPTTGNGRRESFAHLPMPRMTNTFMRAGEHDPQEMIASIDNGLYAVNFGGGQVDITTGKFVFSATEAYRIERGQITSPVKGATLIGNGPQVMQRISMVGDDLRLDRGIGVCGKEGQSVPVGVGQPSLKIDCLTVGGTAT